MHTCCLIDRTRAEKRVEKAERNRVTFIDRVKKIEKGAFVVPLPSLEMYKIIEMEILLSFVDCKMQMHISIGEHLPIVSEQ
jgi:hypothetical protein